MGQDFLDISSIKNVGNSIPVLSSIEWIFNILLTNIIQMNINFVTQKMRQYEQK